MKIRFVFYRKYLYSGSVLLLISIGLLFIESYSYATGSITSHLMAPGYISGNQQMGASFLISSVHPFLYYAATIQSASLIFTITAALLIIIAGVILYLRKMQKMAEILEVNKNTLELQNRNLDRLRNELENQKEVIAREISDSEKLYSLLIESFDDGISFYDKNGVMKFANSSFYSLLGIDRVTFEQAPENYFLHPDDLSLNENRINGLKKDGVFNGEFRQKHKDGHYVPISIHSVLIKDRKGEVLGSLNILRDITSLKIAENELIEAKEGAEVSYKLKNSFLANISHEVRTPLNSVVGFSNLLLADDITKEAKAEYIDHINYNSEKLLQIIGDIIDLSRLESSQIEISYEETSINDIIREVIEDSRKQIKRNEKPIILTVRKDITDLSDLIFTDQIWLKRVLNHLMDNAIKFTLEGSVELSYSREEDNLCFKIKDTGIGINKDNLTHIFEEFRQEINGHHRPFEGLGVGLTLAREVVERMGGEIHVISEKGIGSEFSFTIPFRPAGTNKLKTKVADYKSKLTDWSSRKCLLVDDNKEVLIYLNRILLDTGIEIITARSGPEAIEIIKANPLIDVILLDMQMPEMNGIEATKEIRSIRKDLPIIAQTAFVYEHEKDIIIEAGCDACLIKPIRKEHLLSVMSGFIRSD